MRETLYSRALNNKILVWTGEIVTQLNHVEIVVQTGEYKGQMTETKTIISKGKNIGKSNETTPYQQAELEFKSKIEDKKKKGYKSLQDLGVINTEPVSYGENNELFYECLNSTTPLSLFDIITTRIPLAKTDKSGNLKPMKCKPFYKDSKGKQVPAIEFPCYGQPKINGVRAFLTLDNKKPVLTSKEGLIYQIPNVTNEWKYEDFIKYTIKPEYRFESQVIDKKSVLKIFHVEAEGDNEWETPFEEAFIESDTIYEYMVAQGYMTKEVIIFDGELYIDGEQLAIIASATKRLSLLTDRVKFHIFDIASSTKQVDRLKEVKKLVVDKQYSIPVNNIIIRSEQQAIEFRNECIAAGYEGAIFRSTRNDYKSGMRVSTMVKFKKRDSQEFIILDIIDTRDAPGLGMFICRNDINHHEFSVVPQGTHDQRRQYLNDRDELIGKKLTVEFYERTPQPYELPFHAVGIVVRDYE